MNALHVSLVLVLILAFASLMFRFRSRLWQWMGRAVVQVVIGLFLIFVLNLFTGTQLYVPYNPVTVGVAAVLGVPGVLALLGIQFFLVS